MSDQIMWVSMEQYNVKMIVQTTMSVVEHTVLMLEQVSKSKLKKIQSNVKNNVMTAESYFNKQKKVDATSKKYQDFCDDCILLSALGMILDERPFHFIHPDSINNVKVDNRVEGVSLQKPDYVASIPTIQ